MKYHFINNFHIEYGHTLEEYKEQFGTLYEEGDLWDYSLVDATNNAVEGDFDTLYWAIEVDEEIRIYETTIKKEFDIDYEKTKKYLRCIYKNDEQNTMFEVFNNWKNTSYEDNAKNFVSLILRDKDFLAYVFKKDNKYMDEYINDHTIMGYYLEFFRDNDEQPYFMQSKWFRHKNDCKKFFDENFDFISDDVSVSLMGAEWNSNDECYGDIEEIERLK